MADATDRRAWLTFVIVGAGATRVELAGAIGEHRARRRSRTISAPFVRKKPKSLSWTERRGVLAAFPEDLSEKAINSLGALGVEV